MPKPASRAIAILSLALMGIALVLPGALAHPGPPPDPNRDQALYVGRGKGIKEVTFRLKGQKLIEATVVYFDRCTSTTRGDGQRRRYRLRQELTNASPRFPLRVDGRGRFHAFRSEVFFNADETELLAGRVTPRFIVGRFARESNESASESGVFDRCHTGPFGGPMVKLTFHARRR